MKFSELNEQAKQRAYEQWVESNDSFDPEFVIEHVTNIGKCLGIGIDKVYFEGFHFQGEGAMFEGYYKYNPDWKKALTDYCPNSPEFFNLGERLEKIYQTYGDYSVTVTHSGRYYHENSNYISIDVSEQEDEDGEVFINVDDLDEEITDELRGFMQDIFFMLRKEYEWSNSYEYFSEMVEDLEEFGEEG